LMRGRCARHVIVLLQALRFLVWRRRGRKRVMVEMVGKRSGRGQEEGGVSAAGALLSIADLARWLFRGRSPMGGRLLHEGAFTARQRGLSLGTERGSWADGPWAHRPRWGSEGLKQGRAPFLPVRGC